MKKILPVFFFFLFCKLSVHGQKPEDLLNNWSAKSPIEKVYLHFDRDNYLAGETVWFKAYLYSDFFPDTISTTLYVELLNSSAVLVSKKIIPVIFGNSKGQFELPDTLPTGNYYIRAYSPTMLNHPDEFLFQRSIYIYGKKNPAITQSSEKQIRVEYFPESGNFVAGLPNTIAFKITDRNGQPLNLSGIVKNETGDSIAAFSSYHDGMGMFDINPSKDAKYYVQLNDDSSFRKYYLPVVSASGIVFRLMPDPKGRYFEIYQQPADPSLKAAYIIGQMQHHVVFRMELNADKNDINGFINTQKLNSGILQATIFNKEGMPLAERLSFIDNKEYRQKAELIADTVNFSEKARNHFTLSFTDTVGGSFSVAVTDPDYSTELMRKENIISNLLLTSDLKGYVHNPAYYFSAADDSVNNALDILMMIHGWRRFKWTELAGISGAPLRYHDPGYITITGKVNIRGTKKPLSNKELFLLVSSVEDSINTSMQFLQTDANGKFRLDSLIFFGKTRFFVSDVQGRKNKWLDIYTDADSLPTSFLLRGINTKQLLSGNGRLNDISPKLAYDYENILKANGQMLEGITVKVKKKSPVQELEERYASGQFTGLTEKTIDLVNTNEKIYQNNIFDYIQSRVPGIKVERNGLIYSLFYLQRFSLSGNHIPMVLYLNEMQTNARLIATIPASQIAMIKVFSSFFGAEGNGAGGILAVYTKDGVDLTNSLSTSADIFQYRGYSVIKEFYSPDYIAGADATQPSPAKDHRITLHWQPDIFVDGVNAKVPVIFYNNDRSRSFKVIVEGMTSEGKMVFIEKIISPVQKGF